MKNLIFLFVLTLAFFACSGDDNDEKTKEQQLPVTVENLVGKWQLKEECYYDFQTPLKCTDANSENTHFFLLQSDGVVETNKNPNDCNKGIYTIENDNNLYMLFECIDFQFTVEKLTKSRLSLNSQAIDGSVIYKYVKIN